LHGIDAIHARHSQGEKSHARTLSNKLLHRFAPITGLTDDSHARLAVNQSYQSLSHHRMLIRH
jgi:hypothetical protein